MLQNNSFMTEYNLKNTDLLEGYKLEGYEILTLHEDGFTKLVLYRHIENGGYRALRFLNRYIDLNKAEDAEIYKKFQEDCEILLRIGTGRHPNIARISHPQLHNNKAFTDIEYIDGRDLLSYIEDNKSFLPIDEVTNLARNIASALAYCHKGAGVIHNDLHSRNVMRRKSDGAYILLDFMLAFQNGKVVRSSKHEHGDRQYWAPERWKPDSNGNLPIPTFRSEVYSFGILIYEALTGNVPFPMSDSPLEQQLIELKKAHEASPPPDMFGKRKEAYEKAHPGTTYIKDYPEWLENVIIKCLEKKPESRFADAKELVLEIERISEGSELKHLVLKLIDEVKYLRKEIEKLQGKQMTA